MSRLPWWMKDAPPEEKRLYFAGCPRALWDVEFEDLPTPTTIMHNPKSAGGRKSKQEINIKASEQRVWMQRISKELRHPHKVLIVTGPTDLPGLALMTWWCKQDNLNLVDLGSIPEDESKKPDIPDTALGLFNMTDASDSMRVQTARDFLYRYRDRFVALSVAGPVEPIEYAREVLRFFKFNAVFHIEGVVAIDKGRLK